MTVLPLGSWKPDAASLGADSLSFVRNALAAAGGWLPQPDLAPVIDAPVPLPAQGLWSIRRLDGTLELHVAANGHLYSAGSKTGGLIDIGKLGAYDDAPATRFRAVQYRDRVVATNLADTVQSYSLDDGGSYGDLDGSAPRAEFVAVVRDVLVVAHTIDGVDGEVVYRVRWPGFVEGIPDPTSWTYDSVTQADFQDVSDIGRIVGLTGGEFGTIVGESGVARMGYGAVGLFNFDTVERRRGCRIPGSVVQYGQTTYFWSPSGFCGFDGQQVRGIGAERVDRWFARDFDEGSGLPVWSVGDLERHQVRWLYPGAGHDGTRPNRIVTYHPELDEWSVSDVAAECLGSGRTFGLTLDDAAAFPNMDQFVGDLDAPGLWLSLPQMVAVAGGRLSAFVGSPLPAFWELAERGLADAGQRAVLARAMVLRDGGTATLSVGTRERFSEGFAWSKGHPEQGDSWMRLREVGRTHKLRVYLSGGWTRAEGVDVIATPLGMR